MADDLTLYCAGYGYSAAALAARLIPLGWRVKGTTSKDAKRAAMAAAGVEAVAWPPTAEDLSGVTHFLASAGPDEAGRARSSGGFPTPGAASRFSRRAPTSGPWPRFPFC